MTKFIRIGEGNYINFDHILEIGVIPFNDDVPGDYIYLIMYWDITGDKLQIPGKYLTEEEANNALDELMKKVT